MWLFRGHTAADRTIRVVSNSPINHVGMYVVIEDRPPLLWHAELGKSLPDVWSGTHHRRVQLHDLRNAVVIWPTKYHQRVWLRQLTSPVSTQMEDAVLQTIARLDDIPFPSKTRLTSRWLAGRLPSRRHHARDVDLETADCAQVVAAAYDSMGLVHRGRRLSWYDAGRFWCGNVQRTAEGDCQMGEVPADPEPGRVDVHGGGHRGGTAVSEAQ